MSPLGIERRDQSFFADLKFISASLTKKITDSYTLKSGKKLHNNTEATEQVFTFNTKKGSKLEIIVRAYNEGIAFRYRFPETDTSKYIVIKEYTGFQLQASGKAWMAPYDIATQWGPSYESYYQNGINTGTKSPTSPGWCFPTLFNENNQWVHMPDNDRRIV